MDDDAGDSKHVKREDSKAEEHEEESDTQKADSICGYEDHSMDILAQDIADVELREGLFVEDMFEDLSHVAGRLGGMKLIWEKGMDDQMIE